MTIHDEVSALRNQAIDLLLNERKQIDDELTSLGYGIQNAPTQKRRGRPAKVKEPVQLSQPGSSE
jgi:hypothetical protein